MVASLNSSYPYPQKPDYLVAQEQRGRIVPENSKQRELLAQAHEAGHYGEKAMYKYIDRAGYWWPSMRPTDTGHY